MIILIIEIDGFFHQVLLTGKKCTKQQLKQKYIQAKELSFEIREFPSVFCRLHNFEQIRYDVDLEVEFVIDTDTDRIYSPSYYLIKMELFFLQLLLLTSLKGQELKVRAVNSAAFSYCNVSRLVEKGKRY